MWQPIETAPQDGTWVLLAGGQTDEDDYERKGVRIARPVTAFWDTSAYGEDYREVGDSEYESTRWKLCFWDGAWRTAHFAPTHWMPLPEPAA